MQRGGDQVVVAHVASRARHRPRDALCGGRPGQVHLVGGGGVCERETATRVVIAHVIAQAKRTRLDLFVWF